MYKCMDCGCEFEEPNFHNEYHGLDYGAEKMYECPNCGSTDYEDSNLCDICGKYAWGSCFCESCKETAKEMLRIDFGSFAGARMMDLIDLFNESLDDLNVEERSKAK